MGRGSYPIFTHAYSAFVIDGLKWANFFCLISLEMWWNKFQDFLEKIFLSQSDLKEKFPVTKKYFKMSH